MASAHKYVGRSFECNIDQALSTIVLLLRSALLFWSGVYRAVFSFCIPFAVKNLFVFFFRNSRPLPDRISLIVLSNLFLANCAHSFYLLYAFDLCLMKYTCRNPLESSSNITKYRAPPSESTDIGPHMSVCIFSLSFLFSR